jgi:hypothetical protein
MNKSKILAGLLFVMMAFYFVSCEDEAIDPALLIQQPVATCARPNGLTVSNFVGSTVNLTWTSAEGSSWEIQYGLHGFVAGTGTSVTANATNKAITGLTPTNNYDFYIRTNCDNGANSDWVGPVSVGGAVANCANPTNLSALRSAADATKITVTWSPNGDEISWEVQYGATGFAIGTGQIVPSTTNSKVVTGLLGNTGYDFYVRSKCTATDSSNWVGPFHVNALNVVVDTSAAMMTAKIDGVQYNMMQPYFYPLTDDVQVENEQNYPAEPMFLWVQGDTNITGLTNQKEINLHIPNSKWAPGTYNLLWDNGYQQAECWVKFILLTTPDVNARNCTGTLTVSEFNTATRRIKGTFAFTYEKFDGLTGVSLGIFSVANGTFNYGLDDPYFD